MVTEKDILDSIRALPPDQIQRVFDFSENLKKGNRSESPLESLEGLWASFSIDLSEEEFRENRYEMWGGFPREIDS